MTGTTTTETENADTDLDAGQSGDYIVPEEYRELNGWSLVEQDYILENVNDFWGFTRVDGFIVYEAERFGTPIEKVALVGEENDNGEMHWSLERENWFGTSNAPRENPDSNSKMYGGVTTDTVTDALDILKEWTEDNPAQTARALFSPDDLETDDLETRFEYYVNELATFDHEDAASLENVVQLKTCSVNTLATPTEIDVERDDSLVGLVVDGSETHVAERFLVAFKRMARFASNDEVFECLRVDSDTGNVLMMFPNSSHYLLVAPCYPDK